MNPRDMHNESMAERKNPPLLTQVYKRQGNSLVLVNAGTATEENMITSALGSHAMCELHFGDEIAVVKPELGEISFYVIESQAKFILKPVEGG